jgi:hypothetical protein
MTGLHTFWLFSLRLRACAAPLSLFQIAPVTMTSRDYFDSLVAIND